MFGMVNPVRADDWNAGTGNWFTNSNWLDSSVPTATDNVDINNAGTAQVGATGAVTARLRIGHNGTGNLNISNGGTIGNTTGYIGNLGAGNGNAIVDGIGSAWINSSFLRIGQNGTGNLSISNGGMVSNTTGRIGSNTGSNGSVTILGAGSIWTNTGSLLIGRSGTGNLGISNGGAVSNTSGRIGNTGSGNGSVTVDGTGSTWANSSTLYIGNNGTGNLSISNGGMVSNTAGRISSNFGSTGTVTVDGTGSTWTNTGSLLIGRSGTGSLGISNGGMVSNTTGRIGNAGNGNGSVTVDGTGSTWANSSTLFIGNNGTGNLSISNGGLVSNTSSRIGSNTGSNGSVTVDGAGSTWTSNGSLIIGRRGTGNLSISNGGVVDVTGTVTLANNAGSVGTLNIGSSGSAGVLNTSSVNGGAGTATLNFNHADTNYSFTNNGAIGGTAVVITGSAAVNHNGSGTTVLNGVNTYNGATSINGGTLLVNGSNSNSTSAVNSGGTLGGTGTVGTVNINNGGTFAPGNSIGTTNVTGNVVFNAGSNYNVEVDAAGNSDLINATGSATLTNGTVNVQPQVGTYNLSTNYTILTAAGGLGSTTFNSVNSNLAFLDPTLSYDANNVYLNLTRNSTAFNSIAGTPNQIAVSTVLASLSTSNPAAVQDTLNNLLLLTSAGANQAFDSLSGVQHTHSPLITQRVSQRFSQLLLSRSSQSSSAKFSFAVQQNFASMSGPLLAYNGNDLASLVSANTLENVENSTVPQRGLWLSGVGGFGNIDNSINASGVDFDTGGVAFGADHEWRDFVIGIAGSYARSNADTFGGDMNIDSYQAATYGTWQKNAFYLNTMIGFGAHKTDATRAVFVGPATSTAKADYYTYNVNTAIEAGKDIALSPLTTLSPFLGVDYIHSNRESFTETGAGTANLNVSNEDLDSLRTSVGFRMSHEISTQRISRITPYTTIAYVREHLDNIVRMNAGFAAAPTTPFQISGSKLDRDRLRVGFGVTGQINDKASVNISYYGSLADSHDIHSFSATGRYIW